jgi:hypothetical protein
MNDVKAGSEKAERKYASGARSKGSSSCVVAVDVSKMARVSERLEVDLWAYAKFAGNTPFPLSVKSRATPCRYMRQRTQPPICSAADIPSFQTAPRCSAPSCTSCSIFSLCISDRDRSSAAAVRGYPSVPEPFPHHSNAWGIIDQPSSL